MRILVAEDNRAIGSVICFNLKNAGFDVVHEVTGDGAWRQLFEQEFDLVLTDFQMPGMNGGELCARIRQEPAWKSLPVILLTAKGLEIDADYYRESLAVSAVLMKPFSPRALVSLVQETLATTAASNDDGR